MTIHTRIHGAIFVGLLSGSLLALLAFAVL